MLIQKNTKDCNYEITKDINFWLPLLAKNFEENKLPRSKAVKVLFENYFSFEAELRGI